MLRLLVLSAVIAPCILSSITKDQLKDFLKLHRRNYNAKKEESIPDQVYCPAGERGAGGLCICEDAIGHADGEWRQPTCYEGACYNNQAYELCIGQENGHAFGDGTWCWNQLRSTQCPTSNGVICPAGTRSAGGACNCTAAVGYVEGAWRTPWCYEGSCYTGQASEQCIGADNGHPLGDGTWCWGQERNTRCPTASETTPPPVMEVCEPTYNGYYSYGDCGDMAGVASFEECCELTKQQQLLFPDNPISRFSYDGNKCYFKCEVIRITVEVTGGVQ